MCFFFGLWGHSSFEQESSSFELPSGPRKSRHHHPRFQIVRSGIWRRSSCGRTFLLIFWWWRCKLKAHPPRVNWPSEYWSVVAVWTGPSLLFLVISSLKKRQRTRHQCSSRRRIGPYSCPWSRSLEWWSTGRHERNYFCAICSFDFACRGALADWLNIPNFPFPHVGPHGSGDGVQDSGCRFGGPVPLPRFSFFSIFLLLISLPAFSGIQFQVLSQSSLFDQVFDVPL